MQPFIQVMRQADVNKLYDEKAARERSRRQNGRKRGGTRARRPRLFERGMGLDLPFLLLVLLLVVIGLVVMFSASYPSAYMNDGDSYLYFRKQGLFAIGGVILMIVVSFLNYNKLHKFAIPILAFSYLILMLVLIIPTGSDDPKRWLYIGPVNIQASEIMKFALILFFAHWGSLYYDKMQSAAYSILPGMLVFGSSAALLFLEPHFSGIVILFILTLIMLYEAGMEVKWILVLFALIGLAVAVAIPTGLLSYASKRLGGWGQALNPVDRDMWNDTWQTRNSLYAIGSGGLFGLGLGQSREKYLYIPEPHNDFIFAVVCEELGLVGALAILILFALLVWRGVNISLRAKDRFGRLLGIGLSAQIGIQVVLNILVITDWAPNTGISLPFFSYGGSSLLMLLFQMGLVLSVSRTSNIEKQ